MRVSQILAGALEKLGPNGEHWCKEHLITGHRYCLLGAMSSAAGVSDAELQNAEGSAYPVASTIPELREANRLLKTYGLGRYTEGFELNDADKTDFPVVREALCKTLKAALDIEEKAVIGEIDHENQ